jgi:hypothetical protein
MVMGRSLVGWDMIGIDLVMRGFDIGICYAMLLRFLFTRSIIISFLLRPQLSNALTKSFAALHRLCS